MITWCLSGRLHVVALYYFCMLIIWLLVEMMLLALQLSKHILSSILKWTWEPLPVNQAYLHRPDRLDWHYLLGLEISLSKDGVCICQQKYAEDLQSLAHLTDFKVSDTQLELIAKLRIEDGTPLPDPTLYQQLVRSLMYLITTRPDISHANQIAS